MHCTFLRFVVSQLIHRPSLTRTVTRYLEHWLLHLTADRLILVPARLLCGRIYLDGWSNFYRHRIAGVRVAVHSQSWSRTECHLHEILANAEHEQHGENGC